ncbi:MAG: CDP-alcohol phosphatidyltransferase family protein [Myxococcales bacterium]|jgi:phosphatidylglycerophosphate synthase
MSDAKYVGFNGKAYAFIGTSIRGLARHSPFSANAVTVVSLLLWLIACASILVDQWGVAIGLGIVASFGDGFDGAIAREQGQQGPKGSFLDFYADRLGDVAVFAALAYRFSDDKWIFVAALLNVGVTQFSSMFRNGVKMPEGFVRETGIGALAKAFPALNLRRGIAGGGLLFSVLFGTTLPLSIALWVVASWCLLVFAMLYVKVMRAEVTVDGE